MLLCGRDERICLSQVAEAWPLLCTYIWDQEYDCLEASGKMVSKPARKTSLYALLPWKRINSLALVEAHEATGRMNFWRETVFFFLFYLMSWIILDWFGDSIWVSIFWATFFFSQEYTVFFLWYMLKCLLLSDVTFQKTKFISVGKILFIFLTVFCSFSFDIPSQQEH